MELMGVGSPGGPITQVVEADRTRGCDSRGGT